ncbi:hypothetical protein C9374_003615 [Naegleria lovaniensis]|uniref:Uncharacterized protein n=1 Tax=Naegleria lovaniensis TaxID=51637 RepID=A0AA88H7K3_NAELO|nr:uncharacterized protein C9374_003615 [Naegleria lovaniensis]KAG2393851.1 hypothetical protein C9374_003615 [Naegleria lovaniensis]
MHAPTATCMIQQVHHQLVFPAACMVGQLENYESINRTYQENDMSVVIPSSNESMRVSPNLKPKKENIKIMHVEEENTHQERSTQTMTNTSNVISIIDETNQTKQEYTKKRKLQYETLPQKHVSNGVFPSNNSCDVKIYAFERPMLRQHKEFAENYFVLTPTNNDTASFQEETMKIKENQQPPQRRKRRHLKRAGVGQQMEQYSTIHTPGNISFLISSSGGNDLQQDTTSNCNKFTRSPTTAYIHDYNTSSQIQSRPIITGCNHYSSIYIHEQHDYHDRFAANKQGPLVPNSSFQPNNYIQPSSSGPQADAMHHHLENKQVPCSLQQRDGSERIQALLQLYLQLSTKQVFY